tara:strand:- start:2065 stop:4281 length:2217 start_codon:yes stop_codon:yes gene_type:complete
MLTPFVVSVLTILLVSQGFFGKLPTFDELENPKTNLATQLISSDGNNLGAYFYENRSNVNYKELPKDLIDALIATEDIRFRNHSGIDIRSLLRAVYGQIIGSKSSGGASTITQQLSKMLFTKKPSSGIERVVQKLKEWVISARLERHYTKNEIITMYLNRFDWVNNAVGIKSASRVYFNKKPSELKLEEAATLIGMLKNSALYNPNRRLKSTEERRNVVLSQMKKYKFITKQTFDTTVVKPLLLDFKKASHNEGLAPYLREQLRPILVNWCKTKKKPDGSAYNLYTDGLKIYTTIDSRMQTYAESAVKQHISKLQNDFYDHWKGYEHAPFPEDFDTLQYELVMNQAIKRSERFKKMKASGKSNEEIEKAFKTKVKTKLFSWNGVIDSLISPFDSILYNKFFIHCGMMSMDPKTGFIKAYVGGIDHKFFKYDHVIKGKRQVGSTFKPFLYALAVQEGYSACKKVPNVPVVFDKNIWRLEKDWAPKNSGNDFEGLPLTMKFGLANSINSMTAYIMKQFGPYAVVDLARKMGVKSKILAVPSLCLGTFDLSVYEMVGAYSTFVNKGVWTEPMFINKITDKNGVVLENFSPQTQEAMSQKTADIMIRLLQGVVDGVYSPEAKVRRGTGVRLRYRYGFKNEIAGKTGTTQNQSDGWFMGITPDLVTGVWTGCEDRSVHFRDIQNGQGANTALPVFAEFMKAIYDDTLNFGPITKKFDISKSIDISIDCDDDLIKFNDNFDEEF